MSHGGMKKTNAFSLANKETDHLGEPGNNSDVMWKYIFERNVYEVSQLDQTCSGEDPMANKIFYMSWISIKFSRDCTMDLLELPFSHYYWLYCISKYWSSCLPLCVIKHQDIDTYGRVEV
jgi:hypothetical protein